jgi:hypothetical protein
MTLKTYRPLVSDVVWSGEVCRRSKKFLRSLLSGHVRAPVLYRLIQEESAIRWEMIVCVILSKKVYINMCPIFDGYGVLGTFLFPYTLSCETRWLIVCVASWLAHPAIDSPVSVSRHLEGVYRIRGRWGGWVFAWLEAHSSAAAGYKSIVWGVQ